jgi:hypothetical protein
MIDALSISIGVLVEQEQHLQDKTTGFGATGHLKGLKKIGFGPISGRIRGLVSAGYGD